MREKPRWIAGVLATVFLVISCSQGESDDSPVQVETNSPPPLNETEQRIADYLGPWVERGDFKGVVLVAKGDDVVAKRAFGMEGVDVSEPKEETRFRIASLTKTMTSGAILILRDQEKLSLDDTLDQYLPDFPSGDKITIEYLLAHAGGVSNPDDALYWDEQTTIDDLVTNIASKPLLFEPGTESRYSNAGYNLLAKVIEVVSGTTYEQALDDLIFTPLGMESTGNYFGSEDPRLVTGNVPGPDKSGVRPVPRMNFRAATGSGSIATTVDDLQRWGLAVARAELFSFDGLFWPFGWGKIEAADHDGLEQTGMLPGYSSSLAVYQEEEVVVVCLNSVEAQDWIRWNHDLSRIAFGETPEPVELPKAAPPPDDLDKYAGTYEGDDWIVRAVNDGGLFLYFGESRAGKYLIPKEGGGFFLRNDAGTIRFESDEDGNVSAFVWNVGDRTFTFTRVKPGK